MANGWEAGASALKAAGFLSGPSGRSLGSGGLGEGVWGRGFWGAVTGASWVGFQGVRRMDLLASRSLTPFPRSQGFRCRSASIKMDRQVGSSFEFGLTMKKENLWPN